MFVSKHFTLWVSNSRIPRVKNAEFSGCHFCMNASIYGDFQICISEPLILLVKKRLKFFDVHVVSTFLIHFFKHFLHHTNVDVQHHEYIIIYIVFTIYQHFL